MNEYDCVCDTPQKSHSTALGVDACSFSTSVFRKQAPQWRSGSRLASSADGELLLGEDEPQTAPRYLLHRGGSHRIQLLSASGLQTQEQHWRRWTNVCTPAPGELREARP